MIIVLAFFGAFWGLATGHWILGAICGLMVVGALSEARRR